MMDAGLRDQLDGLALLPDPSRRGRALEQVVGDLFRRHHFAVTLNPGIALPRQTDVLAIRVTEYYLVECKWRSGKANIDDIDALRSRLARTETAVVGVLVSMAGFTSSVIEDVQQHRDRQVLLVSAAELQHVGDELPMLLRRKREALLVDGRVLLDEPVAAYRRQQPNFLPHADRRFITLDGSATQVFSCGGSFGQFVFVHELPDIDWTAAPGAGVTLDVAPEVRDERELRSLLGRLADLGWATPEARWSIQQKERNWHGLGAAAFAEELPRWRQRAEGPTAHHSEEICYLDQCDGGFYTLTATLSAHLIRQARAVNLSFQLRGIPLDTAPLLQLCRAVNARADLYFRPRTERSVNGRHEGPTLDHVQPVGYITQPATDLDPPFNEWVTDIVIPSPFRQVLGGPEPLPLPGFLRMLEDTDVLVCGLGQYHPRDGRSYTYRLNGFEYAWTSDAMVCRPIAAWELGSVPTPQDAEAEPRRRSTGKALTTKRRNRASRLPPPRRIQSPLQPAPSTVHAAGDPNPTTSTRST